MCKSRAAEVHGQEGQPGDRHALHCCAHAAQVELAPAATSSKVCFKQAQLAIQAQQQPLNSSLCSKGYQRSSRCCMVQAILPRNTTVPTSCRHGSSVQVCVHPGRGAPSERLRASLEASRLHRPVHTVCGLLPGEQQEAEGLSIRWSPSSISAHHQQPLTVRTRRPINPETGLDFVFCSWCF